MSEGSVLARPGDSKRALLLTVVPLGFLVVAQLVVADGEEVEAFSSTSWLGAVDVCSKEE